MIPMIPHIRKALVSCSGRRRDCRTRHGGRDRVVSDDDGLKIHKIPFHSDKPFPCVSGGGTAVTIGRPPPFKTARPSVGGWPRRFHRTIGEASANQSSMTRDSEGDGGPPDRV